jgi:restriction endonuclease S subunit
MDEQLKIASVLSTANERLARLRDELAKLHLLKVGVMDDLVTGRVRIGAGERAAA